MNRPANTQGSASGYPRPAVAWRQPGGPDPEVVKAMYLERRMNEAEIAKELGTSHPVVARTLREAGVERRDARRPCPVSEEELRRLYSVEKVSVRGLGRRLGAAIPTVNRWLAEAGLVGASGTLDLAELKRLYVDEGLPTREVARRMGCSLTTVKTTMERAGIPRRITGAPHYDEHRPSVTDEMLRQVYVEEGLRLADAAAKLGISVYILRKRLAQAGLAKRRGTFVPRTQYSREELREQSAAIYATGSSIREVAASLNVEFTTVRLALHEAGVPIRRGGSFYNPEDAPATRLVDDLYADPAIIACLRHHDVVIPDLETWRPTGPTQTLAPLPLAPELLRELYIEIGLPLHGISLLCGVGMEAVCGVMNSAGIERRIAHAPSPWHVKTYGTRKSSRNQRDTSAALPVQHDRPLVNSTTPDTGSELGI